VCGAWHTPVLQAHLFKKEGKGLKKVSIETTSIPGACKPLSPAWYEPACNHYLGLVCLHFGHPQLRHVARDQWTVRQVPISASRVASLWFS